MRKLLLFILITITSLQKISGMELVFNAALAYGTFQLSYLAHEFGHATGAKLLFGVSSDLHITLVPLMPVWCAYREPIPVLGIKTALVAAAGPLFGIATAYALLKINSFLYELVMNTNIPVKNRLKNALKKPLFHYEQLRGIQIGTIVATYANSTDLTSMKDSSSHLFSDGYAILKALGCFENK